MINVRRSAESSHLIVWLNKWQEVSPCRDEGAEQVEVRQGTEDPGGLGSPDSLVTGYVH